MEKISVKNTEAYSSTKMMAKRLVAGVLVINLIVAGAIGFSLMRSKQSYHERTIVTTQNITQTLEENLSGKITSIDIALQSITDEAERQLAAGAIQDPALNSFIVREHSRLPDLVALRATNAAGDAIYGPEKKPAKTSSLAHRDYFTYLRDTPDAGLVISKPLIGGISGKWMIILARRINNPDRSFAGLAYAGLSLDYLTKSFSKINVGAHGIISLIDSDLSLVARYPEYKPDGNSTSFKISSPQIVTMIREGKNAGTDTTKSSLDSVVRTFSFRKLEYPRPLYIFAALSTSEYLAAWHTEVLTMSAFMVIFVLLTVAATWLFYREWVRYREAEYAVLKGEQRFRTYVENANDIIYALLPAGVFSYVSPNTQEALRYSVDEIIGQPFEKFIHQEDFPACSLILKELFETGIKQHDIEFRVLHKNGTWIWYSANGSLLHDDEHNASTCFGIARDISERKQAEEDRRNFEKQLLHAQKLESLGIMASGIAHDFNNLLQSISGNTELALNELDRNISPKTHLANAMICCRQAAHLTGLMLAYAGSGYIEKKPLNLNLLVTENADMFKSAATSAVSFELALSADLPAIIAGEAQIQQVIMNLITNAAEAIGKNQPGFVKLGTGVKTCDHVDLAASLLKEKPEPGRYVFLEVSDNGCGMSKDIIDRLFDPFFTTKFTGRGLGMSAVMGILKTHSGALFVESEAGNGTTFTVLFPASESQLPAPAQTSARLPVEAIVTPAARLSGLALVVDDEKNVLRTCKKMVELCGFRVITALDGIDGAAKFREYSDSIDVVLMDLTMPNMDGIAAMTEILRIRPDAKVILASGYNQEELSERIANQPPSGFLKKPYRMNELEEELLRVIGAG